MTAVAARSETSPVLPVTSAAATLTQEQPRLTYANRQLYLSYFTISRQGAIRERSSRARETTTRFTSQELPGRPFSANELIGDYQALAIAEGHGYALWNSARTGRLEIVAAAFTVPR